MKFSEMPYARPDLDAVKQQFADLLARFKVVNSVSGCKVAELICICIVCIGTKAEKSLKFNVRTMVIYPV